CKRRCGIDAIQRNGSIDYDECIQCLECVLILDDPKQCVASLQQEKRLQTAAPEEQNLIACRS
ncbi:MAG: hypothetical protein V7629_17505, partial [Motiliproteus sp.]